MNETSHDIGKIFLNIVRLNKDMDNNNAYDFVFVRLTLKLIEIIIKHHTERFFNLNLLRGKFYKIQWTDYNSIKYGTSQ
jgi:hypothetical protein